MTYTCAYMGEHIITYKYIHIHREREGKRGKREKINEFMRL